MMIKTFARKAPTFAQLVAYITEDRPHRSPPVRIFQHVPARCPTEVVTFFESNDLHRKQRINGNALYHTVLSFHEADSPHLSPAVLRDLVHQYFSLRAPNAPCFAQSHHDQPHVHVHAMIAGNQYKSPQSTRQSRPQFYELRTSLEAYQMQQYPQLGRSLVYHRMRQFEHDACASIKGVLSQRLRKIYDNTNGFHAFIEAASAIPMLEVSIKKNQPQFLFKGHAFTPQDLGIDLSLLQDLDLLYRFCVSPSRAQRDR